VKVTEGTGAVKPARDTSPPVHVSAGDRVYNHSERKKEKDIGNENYRENYFLNKITFRDLSVP